MKEEIKENFGFVDDGVKGQPQDDIMSRINDSDGSNIDIRVIGSRKSVVKGIPV